MPRPLLSLLLLSLAHADQECQGNECPFQANSMLQSAKRAVADVDAQGDIVELPLTFPSAALLQADEVTDEDCPPIWANAPAFAPQRMAPACGCSAPHYQNCSQMKPAVYRSDAVLPSKMQRCTPQCTWSCEQSKCAEVCEPECEAPKCETRCDAIDTSRCSMKCDGVPDCSVVCPKDQCSSGCPLCEATCTNAPTCKLNCQGVQPCRYMCETPRCKWKCRAPKVCPEPKCTMKCEAAPTCSQASYQQRLPPLRPGEIAVDTFSMPQKPKAKAYNQWQHGETYATNPQVVVNQQPDGVAVSGQWSVPATQEPWSVPATQARTAQVRVRSAPPQKLESAVSEKDANNMEKQLLKGLGAAVSDKTVKNIVNEVAESLSHDVLETK